MACFAAAHRCDTGGQSNSLRSYDPSELASTDHRVYCEAARASLGLSITLHQPSTRSSFDNANAVVYADIKRLEVRPDVSPVSLADPTALHAAQMLSKCGAAQPCLPAEAPQVEISWAASVCQSASLQQQQSLPVSTRSPTTAREVSGFSSGGCSPVYDRRWISPKHCGAAQSSGPCAGQAAPPQHVSPR